MLHAWGDADDMVPPPPTNNLPSVPNTATHPTARCALAGANHGLQAGEVDGLQQVWAALEGWGRTPQRGLCASVTFR